METDLILISQHQSSEVAYLQDKATIDVQISTAKAFPRNIKRATESAIAIAAMDQETAQTCTYSVPRGGKAITGPSVHLAKIIAQVWGNMRIEAKVIGVDDKNVTCQAVAFDLESNVAMKVEVKRSILTKTGRMSEDMIVVTGNAGNSIALRNAIFAVVPKAVTDKVYREAMKTITGDISDETKFLKRKKAVFDGLKNTYGLSEAEILTAVGKAAIDHITGDDLVVLIGIGQAIKDGDTTVEQSFKSGKVAVNPESKELERLVLLIHDAKTPEALKVLEPHLKPELLDLYNSKMDTLTVPV